MCAMAEHPEHHWVANSVSYGDALSQVAPNCLVGMSWMLRLTRGVENDSPNARTVATKRLSSRLACVSVLSVLRTFQTCLSRCMRLARLRKTFSGGRTREDRSQYPPGYPCVGFWLAYRDYWSDKLCDKCDVELPKGVEYFRFTIHGSSAECDTEGAASVCLACWCGRTPGTLMDWWSARKAERDFQEWKDER